ncbi:unnamed protein product [Closterium sp. NIES-54]
MDVWGPARVRGQGHERYFLLVIDDYSRYTTVFPLRSKGEVTEVLINWIRVACLQLREHFSSDFPVLRLHSDRGGEFSSDLLRAFCRAEGIRQTFTLPASPQQNGIAERRTGMVMDVARTSMIHAAAPHFLWPFEVQYAAHQINLQPRVSLPEISPTLRWTGNFGDASAFCVLGSRAFVRDLSADKLSSRAVPCVFLGFPPHAPGWQFYHPTSRRVLSSQDVTFDESVPYYRVSQVDAVEPVEVAADSGASGGAEPERAEPGGAGSEGAEPERAEPGGTGSWGAEPERAEPRGAASGGAEPGVAGSGGVETAGAGRGGPSGTTPAPLVSAPTPAAPPAPGPPAAPAPAGPPADTAAPAPVPPVAPTPAAPPATAPPVAPPPGPVAPVPPVRAPLGLVAPAPAPAAPLALVPPAAAEPPAPVAPPAPASSKPFVQLLLVAEFASASVCPPSIGGECALSTDVLEDRQEEFQCFAAALPHLVSMLLAPEGDPDAPDIPTPRSYAEAIEGPYSSQWQAAMDAEMASWKSIGTYVDEVPPPGANIVSGMWIFGVKRPPGSSPVFKARYVARGFTQRQGVDYSYLLPDPEDDHSSGSAARCCSA